MTLKEFNIWCNDRASDGRWGLIEALNCISILSAMRKVPFWKRKKTWQNDYEQKVVEDIVNPVTARYSMRSLTDDGMPTKKI